MTMYPSVSIVCPVYNEERYIRGCVESLLRQDYPGDMEIILVDGMSVDNTLPIVNKMIGEGYPLVVLENPRRNAAAAMNIGIRAAKGEYIVRVDAHADFPDDYVSSLISAMREADCGVENVGGVCLTLPAADTSTARAISFALSSPFGMGNSYFRIGSEEARYVDTVPFGCFRRSLFDRIGYFNEILVRNQDDEFNGRIIKNGGRILLLPGVKVRYYPRDNFRALWKMFYQYGLYKPLVAKSLGRPATLRQFAPPLFVSALSLPLLISFFIPQYIILTITVLAVWLTALLIFHLGNGTKNPDKDSIKIETGSKKIEELINQGKRLNNKGNEYINQKKESENKGKKRKKIEGGSKRQILSPELILAFLIIHISYGIGYLVGIAKAIKSR